MARGEKLTAAEVGLLRSILFGRALTPVEVATLGGDFATLERDPRWSRFAGFILRRWRLPPWVTHEDVRQDLVIAAWLHVRKFDPARGVSADRYVEWNAITSAKKRGHKARGSYRHRNADAAPSRHELAFTGLAREGDEDGAVEERLAERASTPPAQHDLAERRDLLRRLEVACESPRERWSVRALVEVGGDVGAAALALYDNAQARYELRLASEARAEKVVASVVRAVVARLGEDAAA